MTDQLLYRIPTVVVDDGGDQLAGAEVVLRRSDGGKPEVWETHTGDVALEGPLRTAGDGGVPGWVAPGEYVAELTAETGTVLDGAKFRLGPNGVPAPLPLCQGWSDYPGYAPSTYAGDHGRGVEVSGVIKAADEEGACAGTAFAQLPEDCRPSRPTTVPAILGVVVAGEVEIRIGAVVALPDGRLRAPNQPCRWLSLLAPISV